MKKTVGLLIITTLMLTSCKKVNSDDSDVTKPTLTPTITSQDSLSSTNQSQPKVNEKLTKITFEKEEHDFGTINQGEQVTYSFKFENTGENDLIITKATGSCGCTVPEYPKEPIKPGESSKIKVSFNSANKHGQQQKTVSIIANTLKGTEKLTIKATIIGGDSMKGTPMTNSLKK